MSREYGQPVHDLEFSIIVASHDRPLRLRWLLNALEEQGLDRTRWEIVVGHDSSGPETGELLATHPLAHAGLLREAVRPPGSAPPGANRNAALAIARGRTVIFTDDDCRPPSDWLEQAAAAAARHPDKIIQGVTRQDPDEYAMNHAPHRHTIMVHSPPTPWAECTNMIYPRHWIDRVGGFDEHAFTGEDTDLNQRCQKAGAEYVGDPQVVTYHCVIERSFLEVLKGRWRWKDLAYLLKKHPSFHQHFPLWVFWKRTHALLPFFVIGVLGLRRGKLSYAALCVPYLAHTAPQHGTSPRARYRSVLELPMRIAIDLVEIAAIVRGALRYRVPFF